MFPATALHPLAAGGLVVVILEGPAGDVRPLADYLDGDATVELPADRTGPDLVGGPTRRTLALVVHLSIVTLRDLLAVRALAASTQRGSF